MIQACFQSFLANYQSKDIWARGAENAADEWSGVCPRLLPHCHEDMANADDHAVALGFIRGILPKLWMPQHPGCRNP